MAVLFVVGLPLVVLVVFVVFVVFFFFVVTSYQSAFCGVISLCGPLALRNDTREGSAEGIRVLRGMCVECRKRRGRADATFVPCIHRVCGARCGPQMKEAN